MSTGRWASADGVTVVEAITITNGSPPRHGQRVLAPGDGESLVVTRHGFVQGHYRTVEDLAGVVDLATLQEV